MNTEAEPRRPGARVPVAVIGMSCRAAGIETQDDLWEAALPGRRGLAGLHTGWWGSVPAGWSVPARAARLEDATAFDARLFGISPRMAAWMDPQHRIALELAWEALEDAGLDPGRLEGGPVAVYAGGFATDYRDRMVALGAADAAAYPGTMMTFMANRISYQFGWTGPSMVVDSACSSGLTALDLAVRELASGESEMALVVASNVMSPGFYARNAMLAKALSPTGDHAPFSEGRDGYVRGDGGACLLLKTLSTAVADGDPVHAVIRGVGSAHSGRAGGLTGPDHAAIADLMLRVTERAEVSVTDIGYVEAHGTGTQAGDLAEVSGIASAVERSSGEPAAPSPRPRLWVGSVKGGVGHLEAAAGLIGLVHAILAAEQATVPPVAGLECPDPAIPTASGRIGIPVRCEPWPAGAPLAAVNSFGLGGAMTHVLFEPVRPRSATPARLPDAARVLPLSTRSGASLALFAKRLVRRVEDDEQIDLAAMAWTLQSRRTQWPTRRALVVQDLAGLCRGLRVIAEETVPDAEAPTGLDRLPPEVRSTVEGWLAGGDAKWRDLWMGEVPARISLPVVPRERASYHFDQRTRTKP